MYVMIVKRLCTAPSHTTWPRTTISALCARGTQNAAMRFQTRNAYYLRISATTVIPLYVRRVLSSEKDAF